MYTTIFSGIIFVEGKHPEATAIQKIEVSIGGFSAQLKSLNDVKAKLAESARQLGANAVIEFKYGQKSSWWSGDSVKWYGSGVAAKLPEQTYQQITSSTQA